MQTIARKVDMRPLTGCIEGRVKVEITRSAIKQILAHVPVPGLEGSPRSAPFHFPVLEQSLQEWSMVVLDKEEKSSPATDLINTLKDKFDVVVDGDELSQSNLASIAAPSEAELNQYAQIATSSREILTINAKPEIDIIKVRDSTTYKVTRMYAPEISLTDHAFISGTTKTKVALALALARQAKTSYARHIGLCQQQMDTWEKEIEKLEHVLKEQATFEDLGFQILERARSLAEKRDALENRVRAEYRGGTPQNLDLDTVTRRASMGGSIISAPCTDISASIQG